MQGLVTERMVQKDNILTLPLGRRKVIAIVNACLSLDPDSADRDGALIVDLSYKDLTRDFLVATCPDVVIAPLFNSHFDVIDVIERLQKAGFRGRLCAVTARIPDGQSVEAEIRRHSLDIDFRLIELD